jgi:hypothetical protein
MDINFLQIYLFLQSTHKNLFNGRQHESCSPKFMEFGLRPIMIKDSLPMTLSDYDDFIL